VLEEELDEPEELEEHEEQGEIDPKAGEGEGCGAPPVSSPPGGTGQSAKPISAEKKIRRRRKIGRSLRGAYFSLRTLGVCMVNITEKNSRPSKAAGAHDF
jgi:hypothetical protein